LRQCVSTAALGALLVSLPNFTADAADASSWDGDARSAVRLLAGSPLGADGALRAGVEIRLAAGWKTYWRYPGDSGVPPVFDFSKSENVKSVSILWPAPLRFTDTAARRSDTRAASYSRSMSCLKVRATDHAALALDYAVCEKLCVPARGQAALELASTSSPHDVRLAAARAQAPSRPAWVRPRPLVSRQCGGSLDGPSRGLS